jgi:hypothetical protein
VSAAPAELPTAASTLQRPQGIGVAMLVAAGVVNLPLVYLFIRAEAPPYAVFAAGLLAMGLAWSGGFFLEGKRLRVAQGVAALGVAEGAAALHPLVRDVDGAFFPLAAMVLSLAGLLMTRGRKPTPRAMRAERG